MTLKQILNTLKALGFPMSARTIQRWLKRRAVPTYGPSQKFRFYDAQAVAIGIEEDFRQTIERPRRKLLTVAALKRKGGAK